MSNYLLTTYTLFWTVSKVLLRGFEGDFGGFIGLKEEETRQKVYKSDVYDYCGGWDAHR